MTISTVVFDLGGVVLDWNPAHLYRRLLPDEAAVQEFLTTVCTLEWHFQHDAGVPMARTLPEKAAEHPDHAELIHAWRTRYVDMVAGPIPGIEQVLADLVGRVRLLALTNMPAEVVGDLRRSFGVLDTFEAMLVSGEEGVVKPDAAIYELLLSRFGLDPAATVFVDDMDRNVAGARAVGLHAVQFLDTPTLRADLRALGVDVPA